MYHLSVSEAGLLEKPGRALSVAYQVQGRRNWGAPHPHFGITKGQLILKGLFAILEFFQKTKETIQS